MRKISAILFIVAACGSDSSNNPDAPPVTPDVAVVPDAAPDAFVREPDLSCLGNTAPIGAPDSVKLSGIATDIDLGTRMPVPVKDATVRAYRNGGNMELSPIVMTDAQGAFTLTVANASMLPIDGHIRATKAGHRNLRLYLAAPIVADLANAPLLMLSSSTFEIIRSIAMKAQAVEKGTVGLLVLDCTNQPVAGATISVKQGDVENATPDQTWDTGQAGTYLIFNVPPGTTTVTASYKGMAFLAHDIDVAPTTTATTAVRPGY